MDYYLKYIKYKKKYLEHKKLVGGAFAFDNTSNFFIMVKIGGDTLGRVNERRKVYGLGPLDNLHITLLQLQVNNDNTASQIFKNTDFLEEVAKIFKEEILDQGVEFISRRGAYDLYGPLSNFMVKKYITHHTQNFKNFRARFYEKLNTTLGYTPSIREIEAGTGSDVETFRIYTYGTKDLYAVSTEKYLGINTWEPHISILNTGKLDHSQQRVLNTLRTKNEKINFLISFLGNNLPPISSIMLGANNPRNDFDALLFSYNVLRSRNMKQFEYKLDNGTMVQEI